MSLPGSPLEQASQFSASQLLFDVKAGEGEHAELLLLRERNRAGCGRRGL